MFQCVTSHSSLFSSMSATAVHAFPLFTTNKQPLLLLLGILATPAVYTSANTSTDIISSTFLVFTLQSTLKTQVSRCRLGPHWRIAGWILGLICFSRGVSVSKLVWRNYLPQLWLVNIKHVWFLWLKICDVTGTVMECVEKPTMKASRPGGATNWI